MNNFHRATIVVTQNVSEYRATIPECIGRDDTILEIGCAEGTTTRRLYEYCREVIGIDKGESILKARERYPWIRFEQMDGYDIDGIIKLGKQFTRIYIDISGSRDPADVLSMIRKHESAFKPELIVVKSLKLKQLLKRCRIWEPDAG